MLLKSLTLLVAVTIAYVIGIRSLPLPKRFSLLKCLKLKRAPSLLHLSPVFASIFPLFPRNAWYSGYVLYGFCVPQIFQRLLWWKEGRCKFRVLLRSVLFENKVLTLFICENCICNLVLETMYNINKCNSSNKNIKKFFLAPVYKGISLFTDTNPRSRGCPQ